MKKIIADDYNLKDFGRMFASSRFNQDISNWDVSSAESFNDMFNESEFNYDLSTWKPNPKAKCI